MFANAYQGCRVFITGHTGFKGSWLAAWLTQLGAEVCGFSDTVPTLPSHYAALELGSQLVRDLRGNICDRSALRNAVCDFQPDIVFHLAAQALVRKSYQQPAQTFETNVMGTLNMLEAIRACTSVKAVVLITSDKCYRNNEWPWGYRETDHLGGQDPYSASKGCAEIVAHSYFDSFFADGEAPRCATVRAGNVIGGGDWAQDRIVPDCARAWAAKTAAKIRNPWATRPWQLVLEPLSGYLWLGARLLLGQNEPFDLRGQAYNFGPSSDVNKSVAEVVETLAIHWPGFTSEMNTTKPANMNECTLLKLCCDKALAHLGWKATLTFDETVRYTAEWYRYFYNGDAREKPQNMMTFTLGQISAYTNTATQRNQIWTQK